MVYNGNSDTLLILRAEIHWMWQVSIWQLRYSLVGCSALTSPFWWWDSCFISFCFSHVVLGQMGWAMLCVHSRASRYPLSGRLQWKATAGIHQVLMSAVFWSSWQGLSFAQRAAFISQGTGSFLCHWSLQVALLTRWQGIVAGKSCKTEHMGTAFNLKPTDKNHPWKPVDATVMDQPMHSWRKEWPWAIFWTIYQFTQAQKVSIYCECNNNEMAVEGVKD